jgi:hypothetical protein
MAEQQRSTGSSLNDAEGRDMRPVYWVARGVPVIDEHGHKVTNYPLDRRSWYDPEPAKAACREWRRTYPDAIVVQERPIE